jgi:hypothetical protein
MSLLDRIRAAPKINQVKPFQVETKEEEEVKETPIFAQGEKLQSINETAEWD